MWRSSVEIHSRAGWKISDNGLLSGNAGSARGKDVNFNSKKKDQKEAEKMIPLKIASRGLFEAVWFIFQCCVFIAQVDMARAVAASFFFFSCGFVQYVAEKSLCTPNTSIQYGRH